MKSSATMVHNLNQLALFFATYPHEEAVAGVAAHIKAYWSPRMREQLHEYIANGGGGLHTLVPDAVKRLPKTSDGV
jgi:formate dehydrogenase subunit delta